ncbi:hypothetical protein LINPERHAP1_LOCUS11842 [Linum perenne]
MAAWGGKWRPKKAEGRALLEVLSWTKQEELVKVTFESDAQTVVKAIEDSNGDESEFGDIIESCRAILRRKPDFSVGFIRRGGNGVAHALAQHSITLSVTGEESPFWLQDVLSDICLIDHES